ncbi:helix-turn-helix domain-containing protein [Parafrankia discariae]|uniref:helix-turn-helix domain-containing protein n=1 Tax=Parafrankia discariae TaxID=365528 RepID=UPI00036485B2|nr:helix-turn-helix domain-containing protein [Parafrankia discariae]
MKPPAGTSAGPAIPTGAVRPDTPEVEFATTDPDRAERYLTDLYGTDIKISRYDADYHFRHSWLGQGPLHIATMHHLATSEYRLQPLADLGISRIHRGVRTVFDPDDRYVTGDLILLAQPGEPHHSRSTNVTAAAALVPMRAAADAARNGPDDPLPPLRFASLGPARPADARTWLQAFDYVADSLRANPQTMAQPLLAGAASRLLAAALLTAFPNSWTRAPGPQRHDRTDATPTTLSRAVVFIDANADLDISAVDIARAAHVTVRALQLAFRRHLDTTPMAHLRAVRLDHAHKQLRAASPGDGTTITDVAARWGYANPSRFTARYRQVYGHTPSHTLRS